MNNASPGAAPSLLRIASATLACLIYSGLSHAEDRKFVVFLATSPRTSGSAVPGNQETINAQYFSVNNESIASFRDYWDEISYGQVQIVDGKTFGNIALTWPTGTTSMTFTDINGTALLEPGGGEAFFDGLVMFQTDFLNDGTSVGAGHTPPADTIWTPGERFIDLDADGLYDGLFEPLTTDDIDNDQCTNPPDFDPDLHTPGEIAQMQDDCQIDLDDFVDSNDNGCRDYPEPYEDFLVMWNGLTYIQIQTTYITNNYPGQANTVIGYINNNRYDSPEQWTISGFFNKNQIIGNNALIQTLVPGWIDEFWDMTFGTAGSAHRPAWNPQQIVISPYVPPTQPQLPQATFFSPNKGGYAGWGTVDEQMAMVRTRFGNGAYPPNNADGACIDQFDGDEEVRPRPSEVYNGPREFLDLPSSFYHTSQALFSTDNCALLVANPATCGDGLANDDLDGDGLAEPPMMLNFFAGLQTLGGDGRFGEITHFSINSITGVDVGPVAPPLPGFEPLPDNRITPAGPLAGGDTDFYTVDNCATIPACCVDLESTACITAPGYVAPQFPLDGNVDGVTGTNNHDAGDLATLEAMTWLPNNPLARGTNIITGDFNLDGLIDSGETRDSGTETYNGNLFDLGSFSFYPYDSRRLWEDLVESADPNFDFDQSVNPPIGRSDSSCFPHDGIHGVALLPSNAGPFSTNRPSQIGIHTLDDELDPPAQPGHELEVMPSRLVTPNWTHFVNLALAMDTPGDFGVVPNGPHQTALVSHIYGHFWECWPDLYDEDLRDGFGDIQAPIGQWGLMAEGGMVHPIAPLKEVSAWVTPIDVTTVIAPGEPTVITLPAIELTRQDAYYYYQNPEVRGTANGDVVERFYFYHQENIGKFDSTLPWATLDGGMTLLHSDFGANGEGVPAQNRIPSREGHLVVQFDGQHQLELAATLGGNNGDSGDPWITAEPVLDDFGLIIDPVWGPTTDPNNLWWDQSTFDSQGSGLEITEVLSGLNGTDITLVWTPSGLPSLRFLQPSETTVGSSSSAQNNQSQTIEKYDIIYRVSDEHEGTRVTFFVDQDGIVGDYNGVVLLDADHADLSPLSAPAGTLTGSFSTDISNLAMFPVDREYYFYAFLEGGIGLDGLPDVDHTEPAPDPDNKGEGTVDLVVIAKPHPTDQLTWLRAERWTITYQQDGLWLLEGSVSGPQGSFDTGQPFSSTSPLGAVQVTVNLTGSSFEVGDRFLFDTTGLTPYSQKVEVVDGAVDEAPEAVIIREPSTGSRPLTVQLDASESTAPRGLEIVGYAWDYENDGEIDSTDIVTSAIYEDIGTHEVRLKVTASDGRTDEDIREIVVVGNAPTVSLTTSPSPAQGDIEPDGLLVLFTAEASDSDDDEIVRYEFDFTYTGEEAEFSADQSFDTSEESVSTEFTYESVYNGDAAVRVTDDTDMSRIATVRIDAGNLPPAAAISTDDPTRGPTPLEITLSSSSSTDPDNDPLESEWYVYARGESRPESPTSTEDTLEYVFEDAGEFDVVLVVIDRHNAKDEDLISVTAEQGNGNTITITTLRAAPSVGNSPLEVSFSADAINEFALPLTYRWDFGDGSLFEFGKTATHTYYNFGEANRFFTVELFVSDGQGGEETERLTITVTADGVNNNPDLEAFVALEPGYQATGIVPHSVRVNTTGSRSIAGHDVTCRIDFGDGFSSVTDCQQVVEHEYAVANTYFITSTTISDEGETQSDPLMVDVLASLAPTARILTDPTPALVPAQETIVFDGGASEDPEGDELNYTWMLGDGTPSQRGEVVEHSYEFPGTYHVILTVIDGSGVSDTAEISVTVTNPPPPPPPQPEPCGAGAGAGCGAISFAQLVMLSLCTIQRRKRSNVKRKKPND